MRIRACGGWVPGGVGVNFMGNALHSDPHLTSVTQRVTLQTFKDGPKRQPLVLRAADMLKA